MYFILTAITINNSLSLSSNALAQNTSLAVISILNDKLEFRSYTVTGKLFDAFDLLKQKGSINKLVEIPVLTN